MSRNTIQYSPNKATRQAAIHRLTIAARNAADWLCDCTPGTHQWELGFEIKSALVAVVMSRSVASNPTRQEPNTVQTFNEKEEHEKDLEHESQQDYATWERGGDTGSDQQGE